MACQYCSEKDLLQFLVTEGATVGVETNIVKAKQQM